MGGCVGGEGEGSAWVAVGVLVAVGGEGEEDDPFGKTRAMATGEGDDAYWLREDLDDEPVRWAGHTEGQKSAFTLRIESKLKAARQRLSDLKGKGEDAWEDVKDKAEEAWADLEGAFKKVKDRYKKG